MEENERGGRSKSEPHLSARRRGRIIFRRRAGPLRRLNSCLSLGLERCLSIRFCGEDPWWSKVVEIKLSVAVSLSITNQSYFEGGN